METMQNFVRDDEKGAKDERLYYICIKLAV